MQSRGLVIAALCAWSCVSWAQNPPVVAEPVANFQPLTFPLDRAPGANATLFETNQTSPGADFLRVQLIVTTSQPLTDVKLVISDGGGGSDSISLQGITGTREIWSRMVPGNFVKVRAQGPRQPNGATVRIERISRSVEPPQALSIIGGDGRERITAITDPNILSAGRAVAKLLFQVQAQTASCTAFLISPTRMVTNEHCIATAEACTTAVVLFDYDTVSMVAPEKQRRCTAIRQTDQMLDYTVFDLDQPAEQSIRPLSFAASSPVNGANLLVIQHPGGEPKQLSRDGCSAVTNPVAGNAADTDFTHGCDTLGGSSGSPMLDASFRVVGLHHFGKGGDQPLHNRAVRIEPIATAVNGLCP
jgi:V8-like Glu-specific endopeptidase